MEWKVESESRKYCRREIDWRAWEEKYTDIERHSHYTFKVKRCLSAGQQETYKEVAKKRYIFKIKE